jgi:hypothetical protein
MERLNTEKGRIVEPTTSQERRHPSVPYPCSKLDTFETIRDSLTEIKDKIEEIRLDMVTMIKLEHQVSTHAKDVERLSMSIDALRTENQTLNHRMLELRSNFENQKASLGTIERIGWAVATGAAIIIGKQTGWG